MKHAGADALDRLEPLLGRLRALTPLKERSRGVFYVKSTAFLHFHDDPAGLFADIRSLDGRQFDRLKMDTLEERQGLIERVRAQLGLADT